MFVYSKNSFWGGKVVIVQLEVQINMFQDWLKYIEVEFVELVMKLKVGPLLTKVLLVRTKLVQNFGIFGKEKSNEPSAAWSNFACLICWTSRRFKAAVAAEIEFRNPLKLNLQLLFFIPLAPKHILVTKVRLFSLFFVFWKSFDFKLPAWDFFHQGLTYVLVDEETAKLNTFVWTWF